MISNDFAYWLSIHGKPAILPSQSMSIANIMNRASEADLISVMYYGNDELAIKALKELKHRYEDELNALEELTQDQARNTQMEMQDANNWN
jgi:hypothetical protein